MLFWQIHFIEFSISWHITTGFRLQKMDRSLCVCYIWCSTSTKLVLPTSIFDLRYNLILKKIYRAKLKDSNEDENDRVIYADTDCQTTKANERTNERTNNRGSESYLFNFLLSCFFQLILSMNMNNKVHNIERYQPNAIPNWSNFEILFILFEYSYIFRF